MKIALAGASHEELLELQRVAGAAAPGAYIAVPTFSQEPAPSRWKNLRSAVKRQVWRERHAAGDWANASIVAVDWGLMDVAHEAVRMAALVVELQSAAAPLLGPGGAAVLGPEAQEKHDEVALSQTTLSVLVETLREELNYWDLMYWKPVDGTRPEEFDPVWNLNTQIASIVTQSHIPNIDRIIVLPSDVEEAKVALSHSIANRVSSE